MFHADLNAHIMQCSATAALHDKTMTDRDAAKDELAAQDAAKIERAKERLMKSDIGLEAVCEELGESYFGAVGLMALEGDDLALQASVGRRVLRTIREYVLKAGEA